MIRKGVHLVFTGQYLRDGKEGCEEDAEPPHGAKDLKSERRLQGQSLGSSARTRHSPELGVEMTSRCSRPWWPVGRAAGTALPAP